MTKNQIIQMYKNDAINNISKIYHPKYKFPYDPYSLESGAEQINSAIEKIISNMNKKIDVVKQKEKEKLEREARKYTQV